MLTQTVNISLPAPLLKRVDQMAKGEFASRSDYIRQALIEKITSSNRWRNMLAYGKKMGNKAGVKTEADVYRIVEEYRREQRGRADNA